MSKSYVLSLWIIILSGYRAYTQHIIEGIVRDSTGSPLSNVNIYIQLLEKEEITTYAYSDKDGHYMLVIEATGDYILSASALSFKTARYPVYIARDDDTPTKKTQNITLQSAPFALKEVILNADIPVLVKKDTIIINARHFMDGTEEVVEDVLRKLPGIEVTGDGTVKAQGKIVDKVLVEGDDLFQRSYGLLTKNLDAKLIANVEILEHYSENPLLKNIEDSRKVALNLTLQPERKTSLFGNLLLGAGDHGTYEEKMNVISFLDKVKLFLLGNLNNTGKDVTGDIYGLLYPDYLSSKTFIGDGETAQHPTSLAEFSPGLPESRYTFNNVELLSLNAVVSPVKQLKIRGLFFFIGDENNLFTEVAETFDITPGTFTNFQSNTLRIKSKAFSAKWDVVFSPDAISNWEYSGLWNTGSFADRSMMEFNTIPLKEYLTNTSSFTDQRITVTRKIHDHAALQLTGRLIRDNKPGEYSSDVFYLRELFPNTKGVESFIQQSTNTLQFGGLEASRHSSNANSDFHANLGYSDKLEEIDSRLIFYGPFNAAKVADSTFQNKPFTYLLRDLYGTLKFRYLLKAVTVSSGLEAHQYQAETAHNGIRMSNRAFALVPSIQVAWNMDKSNKLLGSFIYSSKGIPFEKLYRGYALTGFRNFNRGTGTFSLFRGSFYLLNYILGNWGTSLLLNSTFIYHREHQYLGTHAKTTPAFTLISPLILPNKDLYSVSIDLDAFLRPISSNLKLKGNFSGHTIQNSINMSGLRTIKTETFLYGIELRSAFASSFNFHIGSEWTLSNILTMPVTTSLENSTFLDLHGNINPDFSVHLKNEWCYFGNPSGSRSCLFSDFDARYILKKIRMDLKFNIRNLWNTRRYTNYSISDSGSSTASFLLLPRAFQLTIGCRF